MESSERPESPVTADASDPASEERIGGHKVHAEEADSGQGVLVGTGTEQQPGVGGTGDHPAPAQMVDPETGAVHSAGVPPSGFGAEETAPAGDSTDAQDESHALDAEAREKLNAEVEPAQIDIERPDIGTE